MSYPSTDAASSIQDIKYVLGMYLDYTAVILYNTIYGLTGEQYALEIDCLWASPKHTAIAYV